MRPPMEITGGRKSRPKSSLGFGSSQPRWGTKGRGADKGVRKSAAEQQEAIRANIEAEKVKAINLNYKIFQEALKKALENSDDEIFNEVVSK